MVRIRIQVRGIVQGVGFRPFVYRQAARFGLSGFVQNTGSGVTIEIEGESAACAEFFAALTSEAPPLSRIQGVESNEIPATGERGFTIHTSEAGEKSALGSRRDSAARGRIALGFARPRCPVPARSARAAAPV